MRKKAAIESLSPAERLGRAAVTAVKYFSLLLAAFIALLPLISCLLVSFKTDEEYQLTPVMQLPENFLHLDNFRRVWVEGDMGRAFATSFFVVVVVVVFSVLGAYAFSMYSFRLKGFFFTLFMLTMMVPGELLIIQNYITIQKMHLMDTYIAVFLPTLASGFYIYMLREHFMQMPPSLFKSAKVDGTSNWRFLWRVMVPMNRNTIFTIAILSFIGQWNAFLWPELVTRTDATKLVSSGLIAFRSEASSNVQYMMAGSCIVLIPMIVFYAVFNKQIINGVGGGGIKG